jgi:hypothetical protein
MIRKFFILLLTILVIELYFLSFGQNHTFGIPMMKSMYRIHMDIPIKVLVVIVAVGSLLFLCFGLKYFEDDPLYWVLLLIGVAIASCLLAWKYAFGIHSGDWGWSIALSIILTCLAFLYGLDKANISIDPSYRLPE